MLNPDLKLNPKIFDVDVEQKPIRDGFGDALVELGEKNPNVVVLTADVAESTRVHKFAEKFAERFIECGVAEQNMAGIAAGLAVSGKIPFISSYATFSPGKNWETIRTTIIYNGANVKIAGHHAGIITGPDGATHQATEDIAITRCLPNIKIISPCDYWEAKKATLYSTEIYGPVYVRYVREKTSIITTEETPFRFGKIECFWLPRMDADGTRINADNTRIDTDEAQISKEKIGLLYEDLTYQLRDIFFQVYNKIGGGHKEVIYKNSVENELKDRKINYIREPIIEIKYKHQTTGIYKPDFIIDGKIIIEIKADRKLIKEHIRQAFSYLKASPYKLLLLVNFGYTKLEIKRFIDMKKSNPRESVFIDPRRSAVAIFATGHLVYQALLAAKELEEEGIDIYVLNVHTIKPLDEETILKVASKVKGIVSLEDHQIHGGLGSAIAEVIVQKSEYKPNMIFLGLQDTFGESGKPEELIKKYGMDKETIKNTVKKLLNF